MVMVSGSDYGIVSEWCIAPEGNPGGVSDANMWGLPHNFSVKAFAETNNYRNMREKGS